MTHDDATTELLRKNADVLALLDALAVAEKAATEERDARIAAERERDALKAERFGPATSPHGGYPIASAESWRLAYVDAVRRAEAAESALRAASPANGRGAR